MKNSIQYFCVFLFLVKTSFYLNILRKVDLHGSKILCESPTPNTNPLQISEIRFYLNDDKLIMENKYL